MFNNDILFLKRTWKTRQIGWPSAIITKESADYIHMILDDNNKLTAFKLHWLISRKCSMWIPTFIIQYFPVCS